jgi:hypothetical protein
LDQLEARLALGYNDATIQQAYPGSPLPSGSRILSVPKTTAALSLRYDWRVNSAAQAFATADYSYTGSSESETTSIAYPVTRAAYSLLNARIGLQWGTSEIALFGNNLTNKLANLGDIQFYSYRQTLTLPSGQTVLDPRVVVNRPLQVGLQYRQSF